MNEHSQAAGIDWLKSLLDLQGLKVNVTAQLVEDEFGASCWLVIDDSSLSEDQINILIGDQGSVLDSIQYLANTTLNLGKSPEEQQEFTIELAGYRAKRLEALKTIASEAADQVLVSKQEFEIKGLSSAERRQVHHFLKAHDGLSTFSRGREPDRRLVVTLDTKE